MKKPDARMVAGGCLLAAVLLAQGCQRQETASSATSGGGTAAPAAAPPQTVTLNAEQAKQVQIDEVSDRPFAPHVTAVGYVDFDQDRLAQVSSPWAGRVREAFVQAGDEVKRGQALFSLDSPDLAQAEGTLIGALATWTQTKAALQRAQGMAQAQANAPRDLEQAVADEQNAAGNYQTARRALRLFGKSEAEIDRIAAARQVDGELRIGSPIDGRVAARNVAPGTLVQPGNAPAPFAIADTSALWLIANVAEADAPLVRVGQPLTATLPALPGQAIEGIVDNVGSSSDASTHRVTVRATLHPGAARLFPQMLAEVTIRTAEPARHPAVPMDAVVREGDGTMVIFTTQDGLTFTRHPVRLGEPQEDYYPILTGLPEHARIASTGALFISNALALLTP